MPDDGSLKKNMRHWRQKLKSRVDCNISFVFSILLFLFAYFSFSATGL